VNTVEFTKKGDYTVWLKAVDEWGMESEPIEIRVKVEKEDDDFEIAGTNGYVVLGGLGAAAAAAVVIFLFFFVFKASDEDAAGPSRKPGAKKEARSASPSCPDCGGGLDYIEDYDSWYCYTCEEYHEQ